MLLQLDFSRRRSALAVWLLARAIGGLVFHHVDVVGRRQGVQSAETEEEGRTAVIATSRSSAMVQRDPAIITFEAIDVLVQRCIPVGLAYRDALLMRTGLMLPRPDVFETAYREACAANTDRSVSEEEWWRRTTRATYEAILVPGIYDDEERALLDEHEDAVFRDLHDNLLIGPDCWEPAPGVFRLLAGIRDWRDGRSGPRFGVVSSKFDSRLPTLLKNILGEDDFYKTFDFVTTSTVDDDPFEAARQSHGQPFETCLHVDTDDADRLEPPCERITISPASKDVYTLPTLADLVQMWNLPEVPEDDLIETTRLYSCYDLAYHEDPDYAEDDADTSSPDVDDKV